VQPCFINEAYTGHELGHAIRAFNTSMFVEGPQNGVLEVALTVTAYKNDPDRRPMSANRVFTVVDEVGELFGCTLLCHSSFDRRG
jgi:hypothetical protein